MASNGVEYCDQCRVTCERAETPLFVTKKAFEEHASADWQEAVRASVAKAQLPHHYAFTSAQDIRLTVTACPRCKKCRVHPEVALVWMQFGASAKVIVDGIPATEAAIDAFASAVWGRLPSLEPLPYSVFSWGYWRSLGWKPVLMTTGLIAVFSMPLAKDGVRYAIGTFLFWLSALVLYVVIAETRWRRWRVQQLEAPIEYRRQFNAYKRALERN